MKIVADAKIPFLHGVLEPYAHVEYLEPEQITAESVHDADALLIRTRTYCNQDLLEHSSVRWIGTATIGMDHLDLPWCKAHGIQVVNAPGCNAQAVCQYVVAALVQIAYQHGLDLAQCTLGVVGVGYVGQKVVHAAQALGMTVLQNDPPRAQREKNGPFVDLYTVLTQSDFVSFHTPLIHQGEHPTYRLLNSSNLALCQPHSWVINTSRGSVVDNTALHVALLSEGIRGAVLDVWENEPDIHDALRQLTEISTPHIAGYSLEGKANATTMVVQQLAHFFDLPLLDWQVHHEHLPPASVSRLDLHGSEIHSMVPEVWLQQAVCASYDIMADHENLQSNPEQFEMQRGSYAFRREFSATQIFIDDQCPEILPRSLQELGFKIRSVGN